MDDLVATFCLLLLVQSPPLPAPVSTCLRAPRLLFVVICPSCSSSRYLKWEVKFGNNNRLGLLKKRPSIWFVGEVLLRLSRFCVVFLLQPSSLGIRGAVGYGTVRSVDFGCCDRSSRGSNSCCRVHPRPLPVGPFLGCPALITPPRPSLRWLIIRVCLALLPAIYSSADSYLRAKYPS